MCSVSSPLRFPALHEDHLYHTLGRYGLRALAMVGTQNVWQASVPIEVDIDYDIPIANRKSLLQKRSASDRIAKTLEASCGEPCLKEWNSIRSRVSLSESDLATGHWASKVASLLQSNLQSMKTLFAEINAYSSGNGSDGTPAVRLLLVRSPSCWQTDVPMLVSAFWPHITLLTSELMS